MIHAFLLDLLEQEEEEAGAVAVVGVCKLMLSGKIADEEVSPSSLLSVD